MSPYRSGGQGSNFPPIGAAQVYTMEASSQLKERLKLLLAAPTFIGDLPELYRAQFKGTLNIDGGLLKFVDSCDYLKLRGSYVEYNDFDAGPVVDRRLFNTLAGRLRFILPSNRALFYEHLPLLYQLVFGEKFECGSNLLHFIESMPCLNISCYVFVEYSDISVASKRAPSLRKPRHKQFLTRRFIYLLRLFPKSLPDLIKMYNQKFGEDLPVHPRILPAIFRNFLKTYFMVSASNMICFVRPTITPEIPEIPSTLLEPESAPNFLVIERLIYLKLRMELESRYLQFMYFDIFGVPINDFATLERFISAAYAPSGTLDRPLIWVPGGKPASSEVIKEFLSKGPLGISDLYAWSFGQQIVTEISRENDAFIGILLSIPGVFIVSETVRLADSSLDYVHRQLERLVNGSLKLEALPGLFNKAYGYTIPDDYLLREYVLHTGSLRIDGEGTVMKKVLEMPTTSARVKEPSPAGKNAVPNASGDPDAEQKRNVVELLEKRATRLDKIRLEYEQRFRHGLKVGTKLSSWLLTIRGIRCDIKNQIVYSARLSEAQAQAITVIVERKGINFEDIPAECKRRFNKDLVYNGPLISWLSKIPGITVSPAKMCTYNLPGPGGNPLNTSEENLESTPPKPTPHIRPRSQEELATDLIIANPNLTINNFLRLFAAATGKLPSYEGKLKTYLRSLPGVHVSSDDRISMLSKDVAKNAKENIIEILKQNDWVPVDEFAKTYKRSFGISADRTWIQFRQEEIEFLMFLNQKVRYQVLNDSMCFQYVRHLANLCEGLTMEQMKRFFPIAYGFTLPERMMELIVQSHPTGEIDAGPATSLDVEFWDELKRLSSSQRRALLHLTQRTTWIRIEDLLREARIVLPSDMGELAFGESIPDVMVQNSRIKREKLRPRAILRTMQNIISWLGVVTVSELPVLAKRIYGYTVSKESLPLEDLNHCESVEQTDVFLRSKSSKAYFSRETLFTHSDNQLHRLFRLVAENPNIQLSQLGALYEAKFEAPIIIFPASLKLYLDQQSEFLVTNARVSLIVPLSEALREPPATDLPKNLLSAPVPALEPAKSSRLSTTDTRGPEACDVRSIFLGPKTISKKLNTNSYDSSPQVGTKSFPNAVCGLDLKQVELSFFDSLIGDREREIRVLCKYYENKFKTRIAGEQLEKLLLAAGYCCVNGQVHPGCKDRLRFLLSARELDQANVIVEFQTLFARSPCYTGPLRKYLRSIGCTESTTKRFRFPIRRISDEPIDNQMLERLLPIIGFQNKRVEVSRVLEEYNCRHSPELTQVTLLTELERLDFVVLTKEKIAFDCGGIHETSVAAMEECMRKHNETFSFPDLAEELWKKTGRKLVYFGNLLRVLRKTGFNVSNDVISLEKKQITTVPGSSRGNTPSPAHDLTQIRVILKYLLRENSLMTYENFEMKFRETIGYDLPYSLFGCSDFSSFLRICLPEESMFLEDEIIRSSDENDATQRKGSRISPARSSNQSCENVFDVIRACGPLLYPSELQAKFAELKGTVLRIPDPDTYLLQLVRATEVLVKSHQCDNIYVEWANHRCATVRRPPRR